MSEEEKKAIEYYQDKEVSLSVDFDTEKLLKAMGITEEDSFENHQIRFKTLLNLIEKLQKENELAKQALIENCNIADERNQLLKENEELKEYKKIAELTKISCCTAQNCEALNNAIKETLENQKLQKENEELKAELERQKDINNIINQKGLEKNYEKALEKTMTKFLKNNIDKDFIPVQEVKELKQKSEALIGASQGCMSEEDLLQEHGKIEACEELLEGRK